MLRVTVGTKRKSNIFYIKINPIVASSSKYYIYATDPFWILIPSYCLRVYI